MINTIKQNQKAVLAFLLALVMLIGIIPFTATEAQAQTIPIGTVENNDSFGTGGEWEDGDELYFCRVSKDNQWSEYTLTANVEDDVTTWTPSEKLYWDGKDEHKLIASYPANPGLGWDDFVIPSDQSNLEMLKEADCMNAIWEGTPTNEDVDFTLKHRMSMVTVTYTLASEFEPDTDIAPEVYSKAKYIFFSDAVNLPMNTSVGQHDAWVTPYQHEGANGEKQFTAIVSPDAYSAGDEFIRITIGDKVLTAKMPNDITFAEGTHYTFNLKVGKDKVELTEVTTSGNWVSGDGWNVETNLDGTTDTIGTADAGKTAWVNDDKVVATLNSTHYGEQTATLTYDGTNWTYPEDTTLKYLENETPTLTAVYAPSSTTGLGEYIVANASIVEETDGEATVKKIKIDFTNAIRNYSRLRIVGLPNQELTVTTTGFTPAGATSVATESYTLTTDDNGNAFLYGTFAAGATVSVKQGDTELANYTFTKAIEQVKSYALYAGEKEEVDLSTLTGTYTITEDGYYEFTGTGNYGIKVESGNPTIVLNNASITVGEGSAIDIASGSNATIVVLGDNTIGTTKTESWDAPCGGIFVAEGGTINITSNGTDNILRAHGTLAAAIGGKYIYNGESYNAGSISISNVTVYAYTNNYYAAAIGAAGEGTCGTINITNAVVYAYGAGDEWTSAPGIGSAWSLMGWPEMIPIPVVIISDSEIHTFRYNPYSDYIGYLGDESGNTYATGGINCGEGGSVTNSTIYCYTGLDATTTDKVVTYNADGTATEN